MRLLLWLLALRGRLTMWCLLLRPLLLLLHLALLFGALCLLSLGLFALGLFSACVFFGLTLRFGALGLFAFGLLALGLFAFGLLALGLFAFGLLALSLFAARVFLSLALHFGALLFRVLILLVGPSVLFELGWMGRGILCGLWRGGLLLSGLLWCGWALRLGLFALRRRALGEFGHGRVLLHVVDRHAGAKGEVLAAGRIRNQAERGDAFRTLGRDTRGRIHRGGYRVARRITDRTPGAAPVGVGPGVE